MGAPYTPTSRLLATNPALSDGDPANADSERQRLDAHAHLRGLSRAQLSWSGDFSVEAGGSRTSFSLGVGAIEVVVVRTAGDDHYDLTYSGGAIDQTKVEGGGADLGAVARAWYLYLWRSGSSLDFEISLTVPGASRKFKSGDTTRRYLACFLTTSAGAPVPLRACNGRYVYLEPAVAVGADSDAGSSYRNVSLATRVPPHARLAQVAVTLTGSGPSTFRAIGGVGGTNVNVAFRPMVLDASQRLEWSANGSAGSISADVFGFEE